MERDTILILDFGSQHTQLIARRFRELAVYSEILPPATPAASLAARRPKGLVLSGGPDSVYAKGAPKADPALFGLGVPVLGVCYGMQLMAHELGGRVKAAGCREFCHAELARANAAREDAEESVRARRLQVRSDVKGRHLGLEAAWQATVVQSTNRSAAREQLLLAQERFRLGSGNALKVTDAQAAVARAEGDYVNAVYAYHKAIAALEYAVGRPIR